MDEYISWFDRYCQAVKNAFNKLGYTDEWVDENHKHIYTERVLSVDIWSVDEEDLFIIQRDTLQVAYYKKK